MTARPRHKVPADVEHAIQPGRVRSTYAGRPAYQRNDYVGWIVAAKKPETRAKRIDQMIDELKRGDTYMKMAWHGKD